MKLELPKNLPDTTGVQVLLETLGQADLDCTVSLGRVCGSRVAAVALNDSLEVYSLSLEPSELENAGVARAKALAFIEQLRLASAI
jgi:hypothetical protein